MQIIAGLNLLGIDPGDHRTAAQLNARTTLVDVGAGIDMDHWSVDLFVKNLFDARGQVAKSIQCNEFVCGDVGNSTAAGGKIYTVVTRPRTVGLRVGYKF